MSVKLEVVRANDDFNIRGHQFHKGEDYYCRQSKDGSQILVQDKLGSWVMFTNNKYATFWSMLKYFRMCFDVVEVKYVRSYGEMKLIVGDLG